MPISIAISPILCLVGSAGIVDVAQIANLQGRMTQYEQMIAATCGFESCRITFPVTLDKALFWLGQLMPPVVVVGPDAEMIFEGYLEQMDADFGQEQRSLSLKDMANRVRTRYTTYLGTPATTSTSSDAASQALYGVKDTVVSLSESTATAA